MAEPRRKLWWLPAALMAFAAVMFFVAATGGDRPGVWASIGTLWLILAVTFFRLRRPKPDTAHADPHKK